MVACFVYLKKPLPRILHLVLLISVPEESDSGALRRASNTSRCSIASSIALCTEDEFVLAKEEGRRPTRPPSQLYCVSRLELMRAFCESSSHSQIRPLEPCHRLAMQKLAGSPSR